MKIANEVSRLALLPCEVQPEPERTTVYSYSNYSVTEMHWQRKRMREIKLYFTLE